MQCDYDKIPKIDWIKVLFAADSSEILELADYIEGESCAEVRELADFVRSSNSFYEILPKNCSKGFAISKMLEIYNMSDYKVIACGDFNNDLAMLELADFAISPSNGQECVKNISNLVTKNDCDNGAIAEAIEYIINNADTI